MFVLCWTSGHEPPKTIYYQEHNGHWGTTLERDEATVFRSAEEALGHYMSLHTTPEYYRRYIQSGAIRAEEAEQLEMF